ncbi:MAG: tetratricopeptide repeat protein [Bryobacteraceae bacterium]|jgi:tetratricopeptide (TPR) repeat protein
MSRWIPILLVAGLAPLAAQDQTNPPTAPPPQGELKDRPKPKTSGKQMVPPEEDKTLANEDYSFNPLESQKWVDRGDFYWKKGKYTAAAGRYDGATKLNGGNAEAWLKLAKADEKLKDTAGAKAAYTKYLAVAPDAKDAAEIRRKLEKMK